MHIWMERLALNPYRKKDDYALLDLKFSLGVKKQLKRHNFSLSLIFV